MKVVSYVYNTLSKFVKRMIDTMKKLENQMSVAIALIPLGFTLIVLGATIDARMIFATGVFLAGIMAVVGGIYHMNRLSNQIGIREKKREQKEDDKFDELLAELRGIREDLNKK